MRFFSDKENQIIEKLVRLKEQADPGILAELQVAKLLRNELSFFAIKWSIDPKEELIIYIPEKDIYKKELNDRLYFEIVDFIYFLEELEQLGFIKFQNIPSSNDDNFTILYDRDKYKYDISTNSFWFELKNLEIGNRKIFGTAIEPLKQWRQFNTDFAQDLQHCGLSIVYPLPLAVDYVNNDFKTLEQLQFEQQMDTALDAAKSGRSAAKISALSALLALGAFIVSICAYNKPTSINNKDLMRIESAINSNHLDEPITTINKDTIIVRQVP